jgi:hypothetical protein
MSWPTLENIKQQCVIDEDHTADDALLNGYLLAARNQISQVLNRKLYDLTSEVPMDETTGFLIEKTDLALDTEAGNSIHLAALLLVAHWYVNRESTSSLTMKEVPLAFNSLLETYRVIPL